MPRFPGCEDMKGSDAEKEECAKKKLLEFIYGNLKYPTIALSLIHICKPVRDTLSFLEKYLRYPYLKIKVII